MFGTLSTIWSLLQAFLGTHRKAAAIKDRVVEEGHNVRSKEDFIPAMERVIKSFYPNGDLDDVFQQALNHPKVKEIQAMNVEDAKTKAVPILGQMITENLPALSSLLGKSK